MVARVVYRSSRRADPSSASYTFWTSVRAAILIAEQPQLHLTHPNLKIALANLAGQPLLNAKIHGTSFQRVERLESVLNRALLLQMISSRLEKFTSPRDQCFLRFGDPQHHPPMICFKQGSHIKLSPGWQ